MFGTAAALVKLGIDAAAQKIAANQDNMIYAAAIMELDILLFGSAAMLFLYFFAAKKKFTSWNKSLNVYAATGGGILAVYLAAVYYYLFKIKWALERFAGSTGSWNRTGKMESVSKICQRIGCDRNAGICGIFFITLWLALRKGSEEAKKA